MRARVGPVGLLLGGIGAALATACAHTPQPVKAAAEPGSTASEPAAAGEPDPPPTTPPQPPWSEPAPEPAPARPSSPAEPEEAAADSRWQTLIVVDPGGEEDVEEVDLATAARAERERRAKAPPASRVINNKNLVKADGARTQAKPAAKPAPVKPEAEKVPSAAALPDGADERYWRNRSYELRQRWKEAVDEIEELERDADGLRRRFYAESDPYVRDTRVKPDWDRVLDRIREMQEAAERRRQNLEAHLEEGRRAGALPGWLREGIELEPVARAEEEVDPVESVEPPIYPEPIAEPPGREKDAAR